MNYSPKKQGQARERVWRGNTTAIKKGIFFIDEKREHIIEGNVIMSITKGASKYNNDLIYKNCFHIHAHI